MKKKVIIIFVILAGILFIGNNAISLWDQDEAAYAGFGKTMIETGDYVVPQFMWSDVHRKTPMHFWLISAAYKIFGVNEFALRFFSSLAIFFVYLLVYLYGRKWLGEKTALLSALILGSSVFMPALGKIAFTDGLLLFAHTLAAFSLIEVLRTKSFLQVLIFWVAIAFGILVKGPPVLLFAGFMIIFLFVFHPDRKNLIRLHPWIFSFLALLPLYLWGRAAWQTDDGTFIKWLIDWYILKRVDQAVFSQTGPPGYFLATFILFFIAYLAFLPAAFVKAFKAFRQKNSSTFLLLVWLVSGWLFFEFIKSKLPTYAVAAYPAIAMLIAQQIIDFSENNKSLKITKISIIFQTILTFVFFGIAAWSVLKIIPNEWSIFNKIIVIFVPILLFVGTFTAMIFLYRSEKIKFVQTIIANAVIFTILAFTVMLPAIDGLKDSTKRAAEYIAANNYNVETVVVSNDFGKPPSLPFYIEKFVPNANIIEDYDLVSIASKFKSNKNYAFVLNKEQLDELLKLFDNINFKQISSLNTGQSGENNYYIVFNNNTPLNLE